MDKILSILAAIVLSVSIAEPAATPTDIEYVFGPLEVVDWTEEEEESIEPYAYIEIVNPRPTIYFGDRVTLLCVVVGMDHVDYTIRWQYCEDISVGDYHDIDCHDREYTFEATMDNVGYYYRVVVCPNKK